MSYHTHLLFNSSLGKTKWEETVVNNKICPFCARDKLTGIIASEDSIILLKNKYPVLRDSEQLVLIETDQCNSEFSLYSKPHLYKLIRFGIEKWLNMECCSDYKSVIFFKNHGPYSGGTIRHPHMQIIGLKTITYQESIKAEHFSGMEIANKGSAVFNLSTEPRIGFFEFNVILKELSDINYMADFMQSAAHYILNYLNRRYSSYNIFFYHLENKIIAKIVPRFLTSPLFIGYSIPQVSDHLEDVVKDIQNKYFD